MEDYRLMTGRAHRVFAQNIAKELETTLCPVDVSSFSDGEINLQIKESVRGKHIVIVQPTCAPTHENLMEILLMADALKRSSAKIITAVIPYFGYARQDRKAAPRVPISARLVANLLETSGISRIITMDLHAAQIQGFFDIPVDNLYGSIIFYDYIKAQKDISFDNLAIASPDIGGVARARSFAAKLGLDLIIVDKRREKANESEVMNIIGEPEGKDIILIDDMIDTGGTLMKAATAFKKSGAHSVRAFCTHPILSGQAYENLATSQLDELITTDTIPLDTSRPCAKIKQLSATKLFADVISRVNDNKSVDGLFD